MSWDPTQYLKFVDHRLRPAIDLLNRIDLADPAEIYDLGAGAGNVTRHLRARWPNAQITGVDESEAMLTKAAETPGIDWQRADLATWQAPRPADLIYSNAALHWLGDHDRLFPSLLAMLAPGGVLAVQMPRMFTAPSHTLVAEAARSGPWRGALEPLLRPPPVAEPGFYYDLLAPRAAMVDIWETEYLHVLEGNDPVKEWFKGSWLAQFLDALDQPQRGDFEACYTRLVADAYPRRPDGHTLLPFRRLFIVASVDG
jgi:trans-aconitate 2-methyltransferase